MSADGTIPEARTSASTSSWYTPGYIVEAARCALGGYISLDPASCATANATVRADVYHAEVLDGPECSTADGLSVPWFGSVFLNPPSPPRPWWKHLRGEIEAGRVERAIFVGYSIETLQQFQERGIGGKRTEEARIAGAADAVAWLRKWHTCIPSTRVKYDTTVGERLAMLRKRLAKLVKAEADPGDILGLDEEIARLSALPSDLLMAGEMPAHASVVFGYGMTLAEFERAFAAVGVCR